jgi:hypothetical protein
MPRSGVTPGDAESLLSDGKSLHPSRVQCISKVKQPTKKGASMKISIRCKTVASGVISTVRVDKRNITKAVADGLVKSVKLALPDPSKVPQIKGKDRVQVIIRVDGKTTLNLKIKGLKAYLATVGLVAVMTKETAAPVAAVAKKPAVKK